MQVQDIMTEKPACCTQESSFQEMVHLRVEHDCGAIPLVESRETMRPVGIVTDCVITCRIIAQGNNPMDITASEVMSQPVVTVTPETSLEQCCDLMEALVPPPGSRLRALVTLREGRPSWPSPPFLAPWLHGEHGAWLL